MSQVSADGAYDTQGCHAAIAARGAKATIPPRERAILWGNDHPRDGLLKEIDAKGRDGWKDDSGYHRRSLSENRMYRLKQLGDKLLSRCFERPVVEAHVRGCIINTFTYLGMPQSVRVGPIASAARNERGKGIIYAKFSYLLYRHARGSQLCTNAVWRGKAEHRDDANRSFLLLGLMNRLPSDFQYVSLQNECRDADQETLKSHPELLSFAEKLIDLTDTAALCELMDVVISVDTSLAHLAGALGKPVWVLLPFHPDWRWLLDREDSPWYPRAKLFRQDSAGDWDGVFERVKTALKKMCTHEPVSAS